MDNLTPDTVDYFAKLIERHGGLMILCVCSMILNAVLYFDNKRMLKEYLAVLNEKKNFFDKIITIMSQFKVSDIDGASRDKTIGDNKINKELASSEKESKKDGETSVVGKQ